MAALELIEGCHAGLLSEAVTLFLSERKTPPTASVREQLEQRWHHLLNPPGMAGEGRLWLARSAGQWRGVLLNTPLRLDMSGQSLAGHWGVELYVPPSARRLGVGAALLSRWRDHSPLAVGLGITDAAWRLEQRLGWQVRLLPPLKVGVLTPKAKLALGLRRGQFPPILRDIPNWQDIAPRLRPLEGAEGGEGAEGARAALEGGGDALWASWREGAGPTLHRSWAWWNWAAKSFPGSVRLGFWQGTRLSGVLMLQRVPRRGLQQLRVLDVACLPGLEDTLVDTLLSYAQAADASWLLLRVTEPELRRAFHRRGFIPWGPCERLIVYTHPPTLAHAMLHRPWRLSLLDSGNLS
ncbi:MAG: hypothetical protein ACKO6N_21555 [Myxococcota bacterium]